MTSSTIGSSLPYSSAISSLLSNQGLFGSSSASSQSSASDPFGASYSLDLSDTALSMLGGTSADSTSGLFSMLNYSNYSSTSNLSQADFEQILANSAASTNQITPFAPVDTGSAQFQEAELAEGGPLPAFLSEVDQQMHLDSSQQLALQDIAAENMNITGTPQDVQMIAGELQQAGL